MVLYLTAKRPRHPPQVHGSTALFLAGAGDVNSWNRLPRLSRCWLDIHVNRHNHRPIDRDVSQYTGHRSCLFRTAVAGSAKRDAGGKLIRYHHIGCAFWSLVGDGNRVTQRGTGDHGIGVAGFRDGQIGQRNRCGSWG